MADARVFHPSRRDLPPPSHTAAGIVLLRYAAQDNARGPYRQTISFGNIFW